jgi:hypothetical protein
MAKYRISRSLLVLIGFLPAVCARPSEAGQSAAPPVLNGKIVPVDSGATPAPTPSSGDQIITRANQGQTLHLAVGETFILRLGGETKWDVKVTNPQVLVKSDETAQLVADEQREYRANESGVAELVAVSLPPCAADQPPCRVMAPAFRLLVVVR